MPGLLLFFVASPPGLLVAPLLFRLLRVRVCARVRYNTIIKRFRRISEAGKKERTTGRRDRCRLEGLPPSLLHILEEKTRAGCDAEYSPPRLLRFPLIVSSGGPLLPPWSLSSSAPI